MAHRSCLSGFIIDCQTGDPAPAAQFWSHALGMPVVDESAKYHTLSPALGLNVEVQAVAHASRVHLDIQTDNIPAEAARLEKLGARVDERNDRWWIMEAPTGHRFCLVRAHSDDFASRATLWEEN